MTIHTSYSVRLGQGFGKILSDTSDLYRRAVGFYIEVMLALPDTFAMCNNNLAAVRTFEPLTVISPRHNDVRYDFSTAFPKFPAYLRRAAIAEAFGLVSSYQSNLKRWKDNGRKKKAPSRPIAGLLALPCTGTAALSAQALIPQESRFSSATPGTGWM